MKRDSDRMNVYPAICHHLRHGGAANKIGIGNSIGFRILGHVVRDAKVEPIVTMVSTGHQSVILSTDMNIASMIYIGQHAHTVSLASRAGEALHALTYPVGQTAGDSVVGDGSPLNTEQLVSCGFLMTGPETPTQVSVMQDVARAKVVNIANEYLLTYTDVKRRELPSTVWA